MSSTSGESTRIEVDAELLATIIAPYKPHCRYLKSTVVEAPDRRDARAGDVPYLVRARGTCEIPESCYIDDTGHLNAVEFNICYNQLMYVALAQSVQAKLIDVFDDMSLEEYRRRQLPDVLIHDLRCVFKRPIDARRFHGRFDVVEAVNRSRFFFFRTTIEFDDDAGGHAEGEVSLVIRH